MALGNTDLTDVTKEQAQTEPGMAYFAGTGPQGKTCKDCAKFGYKYLSGELLHPTTVEVYERIRHKDGCHKFFEFTGRHGAAFPSASLACKYFEEKPREQPAPSQRSAPPPNKSFDPRPRNQRFRV